jgi:hypothetical protein
MRNIRTFALPALVLVLLISIVTLVKAYAEEAIYFRDPANPASLSAETVSTIHTDLTYVLALAAGFTPAQSQEIMTWDQLADSEELTFSGTAKYSNCSGSIPAAPTAASACSGKIVTHPIWPMWSSDDVPGASQSCSTSRFGPFSPFFHFPLQNTEELGSLHDWGWGTSDHLMGYAAYAWGKPAEQTVLLASCRVRQPVEIVTGIPSGSLQAFATYLHSLGDSYSHHECNAYIQTLDAGTSGPLWGTHTLPAGGDNPCTYDSNNLNADDVHGVEFGTASPTDSNRTDEAVKAIYTELNLRSVKKEGLYKPLGLNTLITLTGDRSYPEPITLEKALFDFVHNWDYDHPAERRAFADRLSIALSILPRQPNIRIYIPLAVR